MPPRNSYDAVAYDSSAMPACDPLRMATIAHLYGLDPVDPATCDVLDIGCGDAINLLSLGAAYPGIRAVGFDPAVKAIERGEAWRAGAGLDNVTLLSAVEDGALDESADYVMAHGVLSWVHDDVRRDVMDLVARATRPGGLVNLSYVAYPRTGYELPGREMALDAIAAAEAVARAAGQQLTAEDHARITAEQVSLAIQASGASSLYGAHLAEHLAIMQTKSPGQLFHDDLSDPRVPFRITDVAELCAEHGLQYVGELEPQDLWQYRLPATLCDTIRAEAGPSAVRRQQLADDLTSSSFHSSLFVKSNEPVAADPSVDGCTLYVRQHVRGTEDGVRRASAISEPVARVLHEHEHEALTTEQIAEEAGMEADEVAAAVMRMEVVELARISTTPPPVPAPPGSFPRTSPLVREEIRSGLTLLTTRLHTPVAYDEPLLRLFLDFLDGTRDLNTIVREFPAVSAAAGMPLSADHDLAAILTAVVQDAANAGLLMPPAAT